jgi:hypothetical protein
MKRFILTTAAVAFALFLGSTTNVEASPHHGGHAAVHSHRSLVVHGHSVNVRYHVRGYNGWSARCWFPAYRTYGYYCGSEQVWYYWYAPMNCYLPTTYLSVYTPAPIVVNPVTVVPTTTLPVAVTPTVPSGTTIIPGPIPAPY